MHHILIVDDERVERNGIKFLLQQMGLTLEIDEAANGKEALEFLKNQENNVDIIFTDIKMPFIDGIELIKEIHKLEKEYKIIIFSGYGEFEYAKFAVKMGVEDYILKPVDPVEFNKTIGKVINELDEEKSKELMQEEHISFMKDYILYSLVNGAPLSKMQAQAGKFMNTDFIDSYGRMLLFEFKTEAFSILGSEFKDDLKKYIDVPCEYLNLNLQQGLLLFPKNLETNYKEIATKVYEFFKMRHSLECYIAVSNQWETGAKSLAMVFDEVEERMEDKFYDVDKHIFLPENTKEDGEDTSIDDDTYIKQMAQDIKMKDVTRLRSHFDTLCKKYNEKNAVSQVYIKFVFSNLLKLIHESLQGKEKTKLKDEIDELYHATDYTQVIAIVDSNIKQLEEAVSYNPQTLHREIESIKQYIYENYDKELSVEQLAEKVYLAPSYLSHVFKKEMGQNLSKFIKSYRMEKAKEMLEQTHKKIVNISYEVGYSNVSYFCQSFREFYGVSPQKFRNQGVADEAEI
ncbi:MAG: response regulator [bacterium]|nr:response regulator [bacterium]